MNSDSIRCGHDAVGGVFLSQRDNRIHGAKRKILARLGFLLALAFSLFSLSLPLVAGARTKTASVRVDGDYVSALTTANRFLAAWQTQDRETGLVMLTDTAKRGRSDDQLEEFFSPGDEAAFEIGQGTRLNGARYSFPVTLLRVKSGHRLRPRASQLVVIKMGRDDWAVDRLP